VSLRLLEVGFYKLCDVWVPHQLTSEMENARLEACQWLLACYRSKGNDFLYSTVMRFECITVNQKWKVTWILLPHFSQKEKLQGWTLWWEGHAYFLGLQRNHSLGVCRKMNSKTCVKSPKRKKEHIASTGEKTPLILVLQEG
jgi:hypothetical protein